MGVCIYLDLPYVYGYVCHGWPSRPFTFAMAGLQPDAAPWAQPKTHETRLMRLSGLRRRRWRRFYIYRRRPKLPGQRKRLMFSLFAHEPRRRRPITSEKSDTAGRLQYELAPGDVEAGDWVLDIAWCVAIWSCYLLTFLILYGDA